MEIISYQQAYHFVQKQLQDYGVEKVPFTHSFSRVLAEDIMADRDFPAFDRATKDGIAIYYDAIESQINEFTVGGVVAAGNPQVSLNDRSQCLEIMTGAVVPKGADTVVMYEDIKIANGIATLQNVVKKGQNIHYKASDTAQGAVVIAKDTRISAAEIGILAAVGKVEVLVKKLPVTCLISTGNELVAVHEQPLTHQIRESNMHTLHALLAPEKIEAKHHHLKDDKDSIINELDGLLQENDVLILSGGVSKGKFDYIPEALENLGVKKLFHKVKQRPGKPFWFGIHPKTATLVFSFPGNPLSTFVSYHVYFKPWLHQCLGLIQPQEEVILGEQMSNESPLTVFKNVSIRKESGVSAAYPVNENGSGDLMSMEKTDGFVVLPPQTETIEEGAVVKYIPTRI